MGIEFYFHPQSPPCQAIWMTLKELALDYEAIQVDVYAGERTLDKLGADNLRMRVPCMKDGDLSLGESRAIAVYLCKKYEKSDKKCKLFPTELTENAKFNEILFGDVDNYWIVRNYLDIARVLFSGGTGPIASLLPTVERELQGIDKMLANQTYIFGNHLTLLDFFVMASVALLDLGEIDIWGKYPNLQKWRTEMAKLPYFDECIAKPTKDTATFYKAACEKNQLKGS